MRGGDSQLRHRRTAAILGVNRLAENPLLAAFFNSGVDSSANLAEDQAILGDNRLAENPLLPSSSSPYHQPTAEQSWELTTWWKTRCFCSSCFSMRYTSHPLPSLAGDELLPPRGACWEQTDRFPDSGPAKRSSLLFTTSLSPLIASHRRSTPRVTAPIISRSASLSSSKASLTSHRIQHCWSLPSLLVLTSFASHIAVVSLVASHCLESRSASQSSARLHSALSSGSTSPPSPSHHHLRVRPSPLAPPAPYFTSLSALTAPITSNHRCHLLILNRIRNRW